MDVAHPLSCSVATNTPSGWQLFASTNAKGPASQAGCMIPLRIQSYPLSRWDWGGCQMGTTLGKLLKGWGHYMDYFILIYHKSLINWRVGVFVNQFSVLEWTPPGLILWLGVARQQTPPHIISRCQCGFEANPLPNSLDRNWWHFEICQTVRRYSELKSWWICNS